MERLLLTIDDVAKQLGVGKTTVYVLLAKGALRAVRIGRSTRIPAAELHAFTERLAGWLK